MENVKLLYWYVTTLLQWNIDFKFHAEVHSLEICFLSIELSSIAIMSHFFVYTKATPKIIKLLTHKNRKWEKENFINRDATRINNGEKEKEIPAGA